jgi:hypothetical protein
VQAEDKRQRVLALRQQEKFRTPRLTASPKCLQVDDSLAPLAPALGSNYACSRSMSRFCCSGARRTAAISEAVTSRASTKPGRSPRLRMMITAQLRCKQIAGLSSNLVYFDQHLLWRGRVPVVFKGCKLPLAASNSGKDGFNISSGRCLSRIIRELLPDSAPLAAFPAAHRGCGSRASSRGRNLTT